MTGVAEGGSALAEFSARLSLWNRRRKMRLFLEHMRPTPESRVVDVGAADTGFLTEPGVASTYNFFEAMYPWPERITAVSDTALLGFAEHFPAIERVVADARDLPFDDDSFDIAFSNAVVEHVGSRADQRRFVHELCRVAPRVFVTTPNRWFPVETHTLVPFVHWLPRQSRNWAFERLGKEIWRQTELLSSRELVRLFPPSVGVRVVEARITIAVVASRR